MPVRESAVNAGARRGRHLTRMLGAEVRGARRMAGISQDTLGAAVGLSGSEVGRVERGEAPWLTLDHAARLLGAVGLDLWVRAYPGGLPVRDAAHLHLLARFEARLPSSVRCHREWPIPDSSDRRALDLLPRGATLQDRSRGGDGPGRPPGIGTDINLKRRDAALERMILLVRDSVRNREILRSADALRTVVSTRHARRDGRPGARSDPDSDGIVIL